MYDRIMIALEDALGRAEAETKYWRELAEARAADCEQLKKRVQGLEAVCQSRAGEIAALKREKAELEKKSEQFENVWTALMRTSTESGRKHDCMEARKTGVDD